MSPEERLKGLKAGDRIGQAWPGYAAAVFLRDGREMVGRERGRRSLKTILICGPGRARQRMKKK